MCFLCSNACQSYPRRICFDFSWLGIQKEVFSMLSYKSILFVLVKLIINYT